MKPLRGISERNKIRLALLVLGIWGLLSKITVDDFSIMEDWYSLFISCTFIVSAILGYFIFTSDHRVSKGELLVCSVVLLMSVVRLVFIGLTFHSDEPSLKVILIPAFFALSALIILVFEVRKA